MFEWLKKKTTCVGAVMFPGTLPPRPEEFAYLRQQGISVKRPKAKGDMLWLLALEHPDWGQAALYCTKGSTAPMRMLIDFAQDLSKAERETALRAGCTVSVRMVGSRNNVLRDRKCMLRFLRAIMGDDGLGCIDFLAQSVWSRGALDFELSHDADLDISQIYALHPVGSEDDERVAWLHSHGLAEIGFFDFDILNASPQLSFTARDLLRAIAYAIVEGRVSESTRRFTFARPGGTVRFVPAVEFTRRGDPALAALRDHSDPAYEQKRAVLCNPRGRLLGWLPRRPQPSTWLSGQIGDEPLIDFSNEASALMAERARKTYDVFRWLLTEFAEFQFFSMVKLGYRTEGGGEDDEEHMWFRVHELGADQIEATLESTPVGIARFHLGQRGVHPVDLLSDWIIVTPVGPITPRSSGAARVFRAEPEKMREIALSFRNSIESARAEEHRARG